MPLLADLLDAHLATSALVLVRIAALMLVAPLIGPFEVPLRMRLVLALAVAALVVPLELHRAAESTPVEAPFLVLAGGELLIGLMLGLGIRILFSSMQLAGQLISQLSGLQMAQVLSPTAAGGGAVFSQLLLLVSTAVFLLIGGHRQLIEALLDTFAWLPAGQATASNSALEAVTALVAQSFILGIRAAAPVLVALLLATLALGLMARALPQLNVLSLGFNLNALVALLAVGVSLGGACWVFQDALEPAMRATLESLAP